jgi:quinol monooxygenase YgiN
MHSVLARWYVKPGKMDAARAALEALVADVKALEPDTLIYLVREASAQSRPPSPVGEILFFECYRDEAACEAHVTGPVFARFLKEHGSLFLQNTPPGKGPLMLVTTMAGDDGFFR